MRHQNKVKTLGRAKDQRDAMIRSMATALFMHGEIKTTVTRAKVL
ncbi:MAG: 50S ribosomal protein L17, partial [Candidatus Gastranaerophilales bacterium]|nr:50S ribosomal protein L17 [Candidatus Gastranaerophilales bacterium]